MVIVPYAKVFFDFDNVQLPDCGDVFCRLCFYTYLDKCAIPKPILEKQDFSYPSIRRKKCHKLFQGVFDANLLAFDGSKIPHTLRPLELTHPDDLELRGPRRISRIEKLTTKIK